jgi:hypothetical protein
MCASFTWATTRQEKTMKKPKLSFSRATLAARNTSCPPTESDFEIYASYQVNAAGLYVGTLKVVRKTDGRLLFPFAGAPVIGPFATRQEARSAADHVGNQIVAGDISNPEA